MNDTNAKITHYLESINTMEGIKDDFDFIGASDAVKALLQDLIDACRWDLKDLSGEI